MPVPMDLILVLGIAAAFCTTAAFLPQAFKTIRTRHTKDISLGMYLLMVTGLTLWLAYGIFKGDLPIIIANSVTVILAGLILFMKMRNG